MKDNYAKPDKVQPTSRQRQIIQLLAEGKVNKEIAAELKISARTAETHRANIMLKFGFHSLADLVRYAIREGIIPVQGESSESRQNRTTVRSKATTG
jgi:DNA-binding NarL/FixJ family response regulator